MASKANEDVLLSVTVQRGSGSLLRATRSIAVVTGKSDPRTHGGHKADFGSQPESSGLTLTLSAPVAQ